MIETIELAIQLIFTAFSTAFSAFQYFTKRDKAWMLLGSASGIYFLGDVYWQLYLLFYGHTPHFSMISQFAWYGSYLFLLLLLEEVRGKREHPRRIRKCLLVIPLLTVGMSVFFSLQHGEFVDNALIVVIMTPLLWNTADQLIDIHQKKAAVPACKWVCCVILLLIASEYAMWIVSLHWLGDTLANPYFWFDFVLSFAFLLLLPAVEKAVKR